MTIISCAVAAVVATFQYAVFTSFLRAGAVIPRTVGADFWVTASSVECFDFPDPISEDYERFRNTAAQRYPEVALVSPPLLTA